DLNKEIANCKKELNNSVNHITHLKQINCDLSNELAKSKSTVQKTSARAENLAKQYNELRCKTEQANVTAIQSEKAVRLASERRSSAENALIAAHQRADNLCTRNTQLEKELATVKVRAEEQAKAHEIVVAKLKRRLIAIHSEASKWKRSYQDEKNNRNLDSQKSNELIQTMLDERNYLEKELNSTTNSIKEHVALIEHLQKQAAMDASNASSRLLAALSTGEEGVATALELKQRIELQLQPELESLRQQCKHLESELMKSNIKCEQLQENLNKANETIEQLKSTLNKQNENYGVELNLLREQISETNEQLNIKSKLLEKSDNQIEQYKLELDSLHTSKDRFNASTEEELRNLTHQLNDLKSTHTIVQNQLYTNQRIISKLKLARSTALSNMSKLQVQFKDTCDDYEMKLRQKSEEIQHIHQKLKQTEAKLQEANKKYEDLIEESNRQLCFNQTVMKQLENSMLNQNNQITKINEMELKITELNNLLTESDLHLKSAKTTQELNDHRYNELENCFNQLQIKLNERENLIKYLENEIQCKTSLFDEKSKEYELLKATTNQQIVTVNKTVEFSTNLQKEIETQKCKLEEHNNQLQQELLEVQKMNRQLQLDIRDLENKLMKQNHDQTKRISEYNEIKYQLKTLTEQFNTQTKQLDDTKLSIETLTKEKQVLLEQIEQANQKHKKLQQNIRNESKSHETLKITLTNQISELNTKLHNTEKLLHDTENRLYVAEKQAKLNCQKAKQSAIEVKTVKTLPKLNTFTGYTDQHINDHLHQNDIFYLVDDQNAGGKSILHHDNNRNPSVQLPQENNILPTSCLSDHKLSFSNRSSGNFVSSAFIDDSGNIRRPLRISSDPASDLENLIRQVTQKLDQEEKI
ncbi:spindle assembly checkpoint component MAD1 (Mitotic arrest deficient 1) isoform 2, partial [Schistosoma japonicum]